mmetsp:Transcript_5243/g.21616  ORF Transcript_5243/g.21616 Transcript_5243/m.21616 type:complete len:463 (-) Transcript_5243:14-1402(-)
MGDAASRTGCGGEKQGHGVCSTRRRRAQRGPRHVTTRAKLARAVSRGARGVLPRRRYSRGRLLDHADHLVEAVDLVGAADAEGGALVDGVDDDVEDAAAGDAVRGRAAGLLDEEAEGRGLEGEAQLGGRGGRGRVREDALLLGKLLVHVGHEAARVAQRVAVLHVVVEEVLVAGEVLRGAHVGRREDLAVGRDGDLLARADPIGFLALGAVRELVDAVVERDEHRRARAVERDDRRLLVAARRADEARRLVPDADHRADGPVVVDDRRPVERVPADDELPVGVAVLDLGLLLRGALEHDRRVLARLPHELVGDDVHRELDVAERVRRALDGHERRAQRLGNVGARVEHLGDARPQLLVGALGREHRLERVVRLLLLGRRVERRVRRAERGVLRLRLRLGRHQPSHADAVLGHRVGSPDAHRRRHERRSERRERDDDRRASVGRRHGRARRCAACTSTHTRWW